MKKNLLLIIVLCFSTAIWALQSVDLAFTPTVPFQGMNTRLNQEFGNSRTEFKLWKTWTDQIGMDHANFREYLDGILVNDAVVVVHGYNQKAKSANGHVLLKSEVPANMSRRYAPASTQSAAGWEAQTEAKNIVSTKEMIISITKDNTTSSYLVDRFEVLDASNMIHKYIYVDVNTNEIVKERSLVANIIGEGYTLYHDLRPINIDSMRNDENELIYVLHDTKNKIFTYDMSGQNDINDAQECTSTTTVFADHSATDITISNVDSARFSKYGTNWHFLLRFFNAKNLIYNDKIFSADDSEPFHFSLLNLKEEWSSIRYVRVYMVKKDMLLPDDDSLVSLPYSALLSCDVNTGDIFSCDSLELNIESGAIGTEYADVQWGMTNTIEYYANIHHHYSFDNDSTPVIQMVNVPSKAFPNAGFPDNACAIPDGKNSMMFYGHGDGTLMNPLVQTDVLAHEFTHLVSGSAPNGALAYEGESGALNESFSDVFGQTVQVYAENRNSEVTENDWNIGEGVMIGYSNLRSMNNPKNPMGYTQQPNTYLRENWEDATNPNYNNDYGGVHANNSIQNYWYFLVSDGGIGTNDNNFSYNITGISIEKARLIAFRNLWTYLTPSSTYLDARKGSILATRDLYGLNSMEEQTVAQAWDAVGVMDNTYAAVDPIQATPEVKAWRNGTKVSVEVAPGSEVSLYSISGLLLQKTTGLGETLVFDNINEAIVIVKANNQCIKLIK